MPGGTEGFDVAPDGQRFLVNASVVESNAVPLNLVLNWASGLKKETAIAVGSRLGPVDPLRGNPRF